MRYGRLIGTEARTQREGNEIKESKGGVREKKEKGDKRKKEINRAGQRGRGKERVEIKRGKGEKESR